MERQKIHLTTTLHHFIRCGGGIDPAGKQNQHLAAAADGKTAGCRKTAGKDSGKFLPDLTTHGYGGIVQVDLQPVPAEKILNNACQFDFDLFGSQREFLVASAGADAENGRSPRLKIRFKKGRRDFFDRLDEAIDITPILDKISSLGRQVFIAVCANYPVEKLKHDAVQIVYTEADNGKN